MLFKKYKKFIIAFALISCIAIIYYLFFNYHKCRTIDLFETKLTEKTSLQDIYYSFGKPDADIGSGIHILIYRLDDKTEIMIGCTDSVLYAYHTDENKQILDTLIQR